MGENGQSAANCCSRKIGPKLAIMDDKTKKTQLMAREQEIEKLKETIRSYSEKEAEWKKEKQSLLRNLNDERKNVNIFSL